MAESLNQQIADRLTRRQLAVQRVESDLRRQVLQRLDVLEADPLAAIRSADPTQFALLARRKREIETLVNEELDPLITARYERIASLLDAALVRLARSEATAVERIVNEETETDTVQEQPSDRQLRAGVVQTLFPSAATATDFSTTGSDWWTRQAVSLSQRLSDSLTVSVSLEETLPQMTTRVRGTPANGFKDGLMGKARADAQRLLTTQTTNALGEARVAVARENAARLVLEHVSVLDARTSEICLARNGLRYTADTHEGVGHDVPYLSGVPYHPNCRSSIVPVVDNGGPVARESTDAWLRRQSIQAQNDILGPGRAVRWRAGTIDARSLIDASTGVPLTLDELDAL